VRTAVATRPKGGPPLSASQVRAQAYAEEREGRIWRAIALLKDAVDRGPDDWTSVRKLADLLTRAGQRQAANEQYRKLAQNCELDQLHMQAIAVWKRILSNEPESPTAHLKIGDLYAIAGLRADARKHYDAALAWFREGGRAHEVAQVEARLASLDETGTGEWAVPPLSPEQAAGREEPPGFDAEDFAHEHLAQARLFQRYGLRVQARARLDALLARLPDHLEARRELRDLLRESGRAEEAREQDRLLPPPEKSGPEPAPEPEAAVALPPPPDEAPDDIGRQMGRDDYETRYDLGIAYREMGLLDEAIAELQFAAASPTRLVESASMLAECFAEQAKPVPAVKWLEKGLAVPGLPAPRRRALQYQLAGGYEACGDSSRALAIYEQLEAEDAGYRDVAERIRRLSPPKDPPTPAEPR